MKVKISLHSLFQALLSPITTREYDALPDEDVVPTTIRLDPDIRRYYEDVAKELGISLQAVIKIALSGLMKVSQNESKTELCLMIDRFYELFNAYKIPSVDIPKFLLPHKVPLSSLAHNDRLLDILDSEVLKHISETFNVSLNWLKGIEDSCGGRQSNKTWYKSPDKFCSYLNDLSNQGFNPEVYFASTSSPQKMLSDRMAKSHDSQVGIFLKIRRKTTSGIEYDSFELFEYGPWGYDVTRLCLKCIMMFCARKNFYMRGIIYDDINFYKLMNEKCLPINVYEKKVGYWEPIDYVSAGYVGDKDTDELLEVAKHYCQHYRIKANVEVNRKGIGECWVRWTNLVLDLENYSEKTKSIQDLLRKEEREFLENSNNTLKIRNIENFKE